MVIILNLQVEKIVNLNSPYVDFYIYFLPMFIFYKKQNVVPRFTFGGGFLVYQI